MRHFFFLQIPSFTSRLYSHNSNRYSAPRITANAYKYAAIAEKQFAKITNNSEIASAITAAQSKPEHLRGSGFSGGPVGRSVGRSVGSSGGPSSGTFSH